MRAAAVAVAILLLSPAAAQAKAIDVPHLFRHVLPDVNEKTKVPVLLPQRYRSPVNRNIATGVAHKRSYRLSIGAVKDCNGATACFVAEFGARRGAKPDLVGRVRLRGGRTGYFRPLLCGASCSAPMIEWRKGGVLYWIQAHAGVTARQEKKQLIKLANSALFHGPR
jgi:hypothetical protein